MLSITTYLLDADKFMWSWIAEKKKGDNLKPPISRLNSVKNVPLNRLNADFPRNDVTCFKAFYETL